MATGTPLQLDMQSILTSRLGRKMRFLPGILVRGLERLIHQRELNALLRSGYPRRGSGFCRSVLHDLDIKITVRGLENIPAEGRHIFASNHPLGGLDGITLIAILGERYGDENLRFLVNDMLMHIEPLREVFLPVNKFGAQGREAARLISEAYDSEKQIAIFPAGLVSRLHPGGAIEDLQWQKAFVAKALTSGRDIIPVRFIGENRRRFYRLARWRKRLGVKFNLEQITLPSEVMAARGKSFEVIFGSPVSVDELRQSGLSPMGMAEKIRERVYKLR